MQPGTWAQATLHWLSGERCLVTNTLGYREEGVYVFPNGLQSGEPWKKLLSLKNYQLMSAYYNQQMI